jgi:hypothetical protein
MTAQTFATAATDDLHRLIQRLSEALSTAQRLGEELRRVKAERDGLREENRQLRAQPTVTAIGPLCGKVRFDGAICGIPPGHLGPEHGRWLAPRIPPVSEPSDTIATTS